MPVEARCRRGYAADVDDALLITSAKNPLVARFQAAGAGEAPGCLLVEGRKLVAEAIEAGLEVLEAAYDADRDALGPLRASLAHLGRNLHACTGKVFARLSAVSSPQGVAIVVRQPAWTDADLLGASTPLVLVAAGVKEPGNLGALLRAAEAAGASGLLALRGGADPFREKAVRGSAGSVFRVPARGGVSVEEALAFARAHRLTLCVADEAGDIDYLDADLRGPCALVLGGEGEGIPAQLRAAATRRLRVPMAGKVESLNVAVAAGVVLYEARRQRR